MLHTNLASLSSAKTLPYLVMFLTSNLGGWAGDYLIARRITSTAGGRKAVNTIGTPPALSYPDTLASPRQRCSMPTRGRPTLDTLKGGGAMHIWQGTGYHEESGPTQGASSDLSL